MSLVHSLAGSGLGLCVLQQVGEGRILTTIVHHRDVDCSITEGTQRACHSSLQKLR